MRESPRLRPPIFVRPFTGAIQQALTGALHSADAFVLTRCRILLASAGKEHTRRIVESLPVTTKRFTSVNSAVSVSRSYNESDQLVGWQYDAVGNLLSDGTTSNTCDALRCMLTTTKGSDQRA